MSISHYQALQDKNDDDKVFLGVDLPDVRSGNLHLVPKQCSFEEVVTSIDNLKASQGWLMYREGIEYTQSAPTRNDFIEGEWCNKHGTIKVKYVGNNLYMLTSMTKSEEATSETRCFKEQLTYLTQSLNEDNCVKYLQWYELSSDGKDEGRWLPLVQQFVGFTQYKGAKT